jgi:hypothetical protein
MLPRRKVMRQLIVVMALAALGCGGSVDEGVPEECERSDVSDECASYGNPVTQCRAELGSGYAIQVDIGDLATFSLFHFRARTVATRDLADASISFVAEIGSIDAALYGDEFHVALDGESVASTCH